MWAQHTLDEQAAGPTGRPGTVFCCPRAGTHDKGQFARTRQPVARRAAAVGASTRATDRAAGGDRSGQALLLTFTSPNMAGRSCELVLRPKW